MSTKQINKWDSRIKKGIAFLDKKLGRKKWTGRIDVSELDLASGMTCVIGETMGHFSDGQAEWNKSNTEMEAMGFFSRNDSEYPLLTRLWIGALYKLGIKG